MTPTSVSPDAKSIDPRSRAAMGAGGDRASAPDQSFDALMSDLGDDATAGGSAATAPSSTANLTGALKSQAASTGAAVGTAQSTVSFGGTMIALLASQILQAPASTSDSSPTQDPDDTENSPDSRSDSASLDAAVTPNASDPLSLDIMAMLVGPMVAQASKGTSTTSLPADTGATAQGTAPIPSDQSLAGLASSTARPLISNVSVETHFALPAAADMPPPVMIGGTPAGTGVAASDDDVLDTSASVDPNATAVGASLIPTAAPTTGTGTTAPRSGTLSAGQMQAEVGPSLFPTAAPKTGTGTPTAPVGNVSAAQTPTIRPEEPISAPASDTPTSNPSPTGGDLPAADLTGTVALQSVPAIMPPTTSSDPRAPRGPSANAGQTMTSPSSAQPAIPIPQGGASDILNSLKASDATVTNAPETSQPQAFAQPDIGPPVNPAAAISQSPVASTAAQDTPTASLVAATPAAMAAIPAMPVTPQPRASSTTASTKTIDAASEETTISTQQTPMPLGTSPAAPSPKPPMTAAPLQGSQPPAPAMPQPQTDVVGKTGTPQPNMFVSAQIPTGTAPEVAKADAASGTFQPDTSSITGAIQAIAGAVTQLADTASTEAGAAPATQTNATPAAPTAAPARTMILQLNPADLGTVNVRLHLSGGNALDVQLSVSDEQTLGMISRERDTLSNAINDQTYSLNTLVIQGTDAPTPVSGGNHATTQGNSGGNSGSDPRQGSNGQDQTGRGSPQQQQKSGSDRDLPSRGSSSSASGTSQLFV